MAFRLGRIAAPVDGIFGASFNSIVDATSELLRRRSVDQHGKTVLIRDLKDLRADVTTDCVTSASSAVQFYRHLKSFTVSNPNMEA